jgi:hypothetical protein
VSSENEVPVLPRLSSPIGAEKTTEGEELKEPMRANALFAAAPTELACDILASTRTESKSAPLAVREYSRFGRPFSSLAWATAETSCGPACRPIEPVLNTSTVIVDDASVSD